MLEWLKQNYCHDDFLTTVALFGLVYIAVANHMAGDTYGTAVLAICGGHAVRSWGNSKEEPPK